ncbi:hypothetical protein RND71_002727 [Anisodus tanguticus]|uniref:PPM-type phosphatase domain-containing protein n=1 Tax=Anisodus tanguticus TaxID=243964 RepID=A0AAE1SXE9_9SOLA|nr:hypothetical protein RND71_002727 [Anisodus tanguticus]
MGSREERHRLNHDLVPLAALISRELRNEKMEKPNVRYGCAAQSKKGEDYYLTRTDCQRVQGNPSSSFSVFAIFDGHNGTAAAVFSKDHLLNHVLSAIPHGLGRDEWLHALPRALVAGFVKTDKEFQRKGMKFVFSAFLLSRLTSGTTATFVIVDGWTVTVACVGDSRCILDTQGGAVSELTVDHRLEENAEERERVTASGGEVGRISIFGGTEVGPNFVNIVKLSSAGGRLIIASDGIWDAVSSDMAAKSCRGLPAELAARQVVKDALRTRGLKDDTTCIVVDIIPPDNTVQPATPPKKYNKLQSLFFRRKSHKSVAKLSKKLSAVGIVEELFEEGSAMLAESMEIAVLVSLMWSLYIDMRWLACFPLPGILLGSEDSYGPSMSGLFICAVCQVDLAASEGISVHAGSIFSTSSKPWQGPFLCADCHNKKDAMEGKRPRGVKVT